MKKKLMSLLLVGTMTAASMIPTTLAYADSQKVVTIGADLTEDQKTAVLKYFGVLGNSNVQTLYITNQDERDHLASYVPIEQIGTRTFSCALVNPTTSGGIQVKTANLSWVTSNMIASTLSTSGVVNCEVLAASPFEVSGTGALTGILMAYEQASGAQLDDTKKELATQELVTTGQIADTIGQTQATEIVNDIKIQIIEGQVVDPDQVTEIVNQVVDRVEQDQAAQQETDAQYVEADETPVITQLSDEDRAKLDALAQQIANQQYNYDDMRQTLERVESNVEEINAAISQTPAETEAAQDTSSTAETEPETLASDSVLLNTDDSALGEDVNINATNNEAAPLAKEVAEAEETSAEENPFEITSTDNTTVDAGNTEETAAPEGDAVVTEETAAPEETAAQEETAAPEGDVVVTEETAAPEGDVVVTEETAAPEETAALELGEVVLAQDNSADTEKNITGTDVLLYDVANADLKIVGGTLTITNEFGETKTVDLANADMIRTAAASDAFLVNKGWNAGTEFLIKVPADALANTGVYTVSLNAQVVQAPEGTDPAALQPTDLVLEKDLTVGTYGFTLAGDDMKAFTAGNQVTGTVLYDAEAAVYAYVSVEDGSVANVETADVSMIDGTTTFTLDLLNAGKTDVYVTFYDEAGNEIRTVAQTVYVF